MRRIRWELLPVKAGPIMWICFSSKPSILKSGNPEKTEFRIENERQDGSPDSHMCERTREEKPSMDIISGSMISAGQSVLISSKSGSYLPEVKRVFTLNHFLKKRETFFDVHAGYSFPALSVGSSCPRKRQAFLRACLVCVLRSTAISPKVME